MQTPHDHIVKQYDAELARLTGEIARMGELVEVGPTRLMFTSPKDSRTEDYITGRFG